MGSFGIDAVLYFYYHRVVVNPSGRPNKVEIVHHKTAIDADDHASQDFMCLGSISQHAD